MAREPFRREKKRARGIERGREGKRRGSSLPPPFPPFPLFSRVLGTDDVAERRRRRARLPRLPREKTLAGEQREVAQMRDDENIGSISKFYFGASAERRSYTQFTASRTLLCPRARNFTRLSLSFSSGWMDDVVED